MPHEANRWLVYVNERSPLPALVVIGFGQSLSGHYLMKPGFDALPILMSTVGIVGLLMLMRMMDELKDLVKDQIAHPERPLPRGLLHPPEFRTAMYRVGALLLLYAIVVGLAVSPPAGVLFAGTVVYSFLMFKEFFTPLLLNRNAFVYALSHQVIVIPIYAFAVAASSPGDAVSLRTLWFALTGLGASFVFEVCRKLDPGALPVLGTYLTLYGRGAVAGAVTIALLLLALSAYEIDVHRIIWPFAILMAATLPLIYIRPNKYKVVEGMATVLGFVQMLAPTLHHMLGIAG